MKYHSPMKIIFLSLILLLVFFSVSVYVTLSMNAPSITRWAIERLTDALDAPDSDIRVRFDRLDHDMRGNITLDGITVTFRDEEMMTADRLRFDDGFLTIVGNLLRKEGDFDMILSGVDVTVSKDLLSLITGEGSASSSVSRTFAPGMMAGCTSGIDPVKGPLPGDNGMIGLPDGPTEITVAENKPAPDFRFFLDITDLSLRVEDIVTIEDTSVSAFYGLRDGSYTAEIDVPAVAFSQEGIAMDVKSVKARVKGDLTGLDLAASSSVMELSALGFEFTTDNFALTLGVPSFTGLDIYSLPLGLSVKSLEVERGDDIYFRAEPLSLMISDGGARLSIKSLIAALDNYALSTSDIHVGLDLRTLDADLSVVKAVMWQDVIDLCRLDGIRAEGNPSGKVDAHITGLSIPALSVLTDGFMKDLLLTDTSLSADLKSMDSFGFSTTGSIASSDELIDDTSFMVDGTLGLSGAGPSADAVISGLRMPLLTEDLDVSLSFRDGRLRAYAEVGDRAHVDLGWDGTVHADLALEDFRLSLFRPALEKLMPQLDAYWTDQTSLTGKLIADISPVTDGGTGLRGPVNFMFAMNGISFNGMDLSIVTSASADIDGGVMNIPEFNVSTDWVRAVFSGSIDMSSLIPEGRFSILTTEKGTYIADLELDDLGAKELSFDLGLFNNRDISLDGIFSYADREHLWSDAVLHVRGGDYAIGFDIDFSRSIVSVVNDRAYFGMQFADGFDAILSFDEFRFPGKGGLEPTTLDGMLTFDFDFASQQFGAEMEGFRLDNLNFLPGRPDFEFSFSLDPDFLRIDDITVESREFLPMKGSLEYGFDEKRLASALESSDERMLFSIIDIGGTYSGLLSFVDVDSRRFGFDMGRMNALLMGRGSDLENIGFSGDFDIRPEGDDVNGLSGRLSVTKSMLKIDDVEYRKDLLELRIPGLLIDSVAGKAELPIVFSYAFPNDDRLYPVSADMRLEILSEPGRDLLEYGKAMAGTGLSGISGRLFVNDINIDDRLRTGARYSVIESRDGALGLEGNFITGTFDPSALTLDIAADISPITGLTVKGGLKDGLDLEIGIKDLNLSTVNMLVGSPIYTMTDDSWASGSIYLTGPFSDPKFYGYVWTDKMTARCFWVPNDTLIVNNGLFVLWDNNIKSLMTSVTAVDDFTGERSPGKLQVEVNFNPGLSFDFFRLDAWIEEGNDISLRIPITSANIDLWSEVSGHFYLNMTMDRTKIGGEIVLRDFIGSYGLQPMPEWWAPGDSRSDMDFDIIFRKNSDIVFPLGPNPILKATLDENQHMGFTIDGDDIKINGKLKLRSGEIFYFQNYFFIRDGEVEFLENDLNAIEPVINLRAQLRDFDENGEKIDIWLTLMDARLDSINPVLSSSPSKDTSEIMSILGQTIVGGGGPRGTVGSVMSLVSTGVDVLSRIGVIDAGSDGSLQNSIRTSLNLDAFSLHSNIVENIVFDALSSTDFGAVSPLARYLDGTSLYIGKHITPEVYLEALAHLVARKGHEAEDRGSFLSSDLGLDIEISAEWENPLCSVRVFTQPSYLNFQEIFDTMGFTLSKRFVF